MRALKATASIAALITLLGGCNTTNPLIADKVLNISPTLQIPYDVAVTAVVAGIIAWQVIDPLAPTWNIHHSKLKDNRYRISMRQKRFATGGDGEAQYIFRRHAQALTEQHEFTTYTIMSYEESVESGPVIGQRVSLGVIQLGYTTTADTNPAGY